MTNIHNEHDYFVIIFTKMWENRIKTYPLASFSLCFSSLFFFREPNEAYFIETRSSATAIFEHGEKQLRKEAEKEGLEGVMVEGDLYFHL